MGNVNKLKKHPWFYRYITGLVSYKFDYGDEDTDDVDIVELNKHIPDAESLRDKVEGAIGVGKPYTGVLICPISGTPIYYIDSDDERTFHAHVGCSEYDSDDLANVCVHTFDFALTECDYEPGEFKQECAGLYKKEFGASCLNHLKFIDVLQFFRDNSWHNDEMPSFVACPHRKIKVWIPRGNDTDEPFSAAEHHDPDLIDWKGDWIITKDEQEFVEFLKEHALYPCSQEDFDKQ